MPVVLAGVLCLAALVNGCAQQPSPEVTLLTAEAQRVLNSPLLLSDQSRPGTSSKADSETHIKNRPLSEGLAVESLLARHGRFDDPLALTAEMRHFVHRYVSPQASSASKLQQLLEAVLHPGLLGLKYDPQKTYSAKDAFDHQTGNCLSFSNLMVALGREVGLKVWFNEVEVPPTWDSQDARTYLYYRHMNVVVKVGRDLKVVDLDRKNYRQHYPQHRVSDDYALAQYYNNLSMAQLFDGQLGRAFLLLREAILLEPELSFLWGNLGTLYRRAGHFEEAEVAYRKGLQLNPADLLVISNLGRLYQQMGDESQARMFDAMALRFRMTNPYFRYHLALQAVAEGDPERALKHIRAALAGDRQEPRFHVLAADINAALGLTEAAQEQRRLAANLGRDYSVSP
ncbi:tetratricopeptide repeat protein [Aestuariicella hydrocarbonica]|uniref:Tetratricopeptide repeat protein n=1 Tax=Pseudomaricurvus hydrocarbonicus TaxID=1470433 RepID=A0A9E5MQP2_9GAMM|nr:tetratricopeptide repeat protein [Aestuariicella hydrocarbonica]NHO68560.1 tetratricopeptide repeat protein [Aestuariicella hydrocarbonica]